MPDSAVPLAAESAIGKITEGHQYVGVSFES
jgi:hypothetical protein